MKREDGFGGNRSERDRDGPAGKLGCDAGVMFSDAACCSAMLSGCSPLLLDVLLCGMMFGDVGAMLCDAGDGLRWARRNNDGERCASMLMMFSDVRMMLVIFISSRLSKL